MSTQSPTESSPTPAGRKETPKDAAWAFVQRLIRLETSDNGPARATLAHLRLGVRQTNGVAIEMMPFVVPLLPKNQEEKPKEQQEKEDERYFQIAALFALHPLNTPRGSFGQSFRVLSDKGSESIEKRFQLLLACHEEDIFRHLVQCIGLMKSENIPINWAQLLRDLTKLGWDQPDRRLQMKWARDFYNTHYDREEAKNSSPNA